MAFYSRQLRGAKTRYSATEQALAVVASVQHFVHYLYGYCSFVVMTDNLPLTASSKVLNRLLLELI